jgi:hypothetical protein
MRVRDRTEPIARTTRCHALAIWCRASTSRLGESRRSAPGCRRSSSTATRRTPHPLDPHPRRPMVRAPDSSRKISCSGWVRRVHFRSAARFAVAATTTVGMAPIRRRAATEGLRVDGNDHVPRYAGRDSEAAGRNAAFKRVVIMHVDHRRIL